MIAVFFSLQVLLLAGYLIVLLLARWPLPAREQLRLHYRLLSLTLVLAVVLPWIG
jgi:hypothetical protein